MKNKISNLFMTIRNNLLDGFKSCNSNEKNYFLIVLLIHIFLLLCPLETVWEICFCFGIQMLILFGMWVYLFYERKRSFNSPSMYFALACLICWYGQVIIRGFNFIDSGLLDIDNFDPIKLKETCIFLSVGFFVMLIGILIFTKEDTVLNNHKDKSIIRNEKLHKSMTLVAISMVLFSFPFYFYDLITNTISALKYGYDSLYGNVDSSAILNIISNIKMFFWPGMIILVLSNKTNKRIIITALIVALISIILNLVCGTRSNAITISLVIIWIYLYEYGSLNLKKIILLVVVGLISLKIFSVVHDFRILENKSVSSFFDLFINSKENYIVKVFSEFGFNIFSLYHTMDLIPSTQGFAYGYTYFAAIMAIIPKFFMFGFSFTKYAALPDWLKTKLNMGYGPGFSIIAESYYNFGYFGIIVMFIIGIVIGTVFNNTKQGDRRIIKSIIIAILLFSNIFIARDTFLMVFRKAFYTILVPYLMVKLLYFFFEKKKDGKLVSFLDSIYNFII